MTSAVPARARAREDSAYVTADPDQRQKIDELERRIERAIEWFKVNDPTGGMYFQYRAGLRAHSRMPALEGTPRHDEWKRYANNMDAYEQLMKKLERLEA